MANIKSQIKRNELSEARRAQNSAAKNEARTAMKKVESLIAAKKKDEAAAALREAVSLLDRLAQNGVITANSAARKKARLQKAVASIK
jgi:small subunit ribosomal protein S20